MVWGQVTLRLFLILVADRGPDCVNKHFKIIHDFLIWSTPEPSVEGPQIQGHEFRLAEDDDSAPTMPRRAAANSPQSLSL